tara:strand:+ start:46416 stop:47321 length:906 start_codon:yes stop_codon:yes gene_type:complete
MENLPQKNENQPKRITWELIWTDFLNVINFEKGVFFTIKGLIVKPKETVDDYLYGARMRHANPFRFLLFSTAIATLLNYYFIFQPSMANGDFSPTKDGSYYDAGNAFGKSVAFNIDNITSADSTESAKEPTVVDEKKKKERSDKIQVAVKIAMNKLSEWMDKFTFASVPIFALFTFLFFRKTGYNYTENLVIGAFMISMTNILGMVLIPPSYFNPIVGGSISTLVNGGFTIYFIYRVFVVGTYSEVDNENKSNFKYQYHRFRRVIANLLKVVSVFLLSYLLLSVLMGAFMFIILYGSMTGA